MRTKYKLTPDIIIQDGQCYLKEWDIAGVIEHPSHFNIRFGYNPEGDNIFKYDKEGMTDDGINAFKKWLSREGIRCAKYDPKVHGLFNK